MGHMLAPLKNRWSEEGGYREILNLAIPLILSTGSMTIQHFVDRMFLTWHAPELQYIETQYFQILIFSGFPVTASSTMAGFFSGRGKIKVIMWVTFATTAVNIVLDYGFIFGNWGFPSLGIRSAALATVISQFTMEIHAGH